MHSEPIKEDLPKVVSYCSKFFNNYYIEKYEMMEEYDLFNQFPASEEHKQLLANDRDELRYQQITNKIFSESYRYEIDEEKMKRMRQEVKSRYNRS